MASQQFEVPATRTRSGTGFSPESGPRNGPGPVLGPVPGPSPKLLPGAVLGLVLGPVRDRSQDRFWLTTSFLKQQKSQHWSQDRSRDWSRDRSWKSTFRAFGRVPQGPSLISNHFQLHPTPVPSAGGWDGRQRVGGF